MYWGLDSHNYRLDDVEGGVTVNVFKIFSSLLFLLGSQQIWSRHFDFPRHVPEQVCVLKQRMLGIRN